MLSWDFAFFWFFCPDCIFCTVRNWFKRSWKDEYGFWHNNANARTLLYLRPLVLTFKNDGNFSSLNCLLVCMFVQSSQRCHPLAFIILNFFHNKKHCSVKQVRNLWSQILRLIYLTIVLFIQNVDYWFNENLDFSHILNVM